jgi:hypothetical protein
VVFVDLLSVDEEPDSVPEQRMEEDEHGAHLKVCFLMFVLLFNVCFVDCGCLFCCLLFVDCCWSCWLFSFPHLVL